MPARADRTAADEPSRPAARSCQRYPSVRPGRDSGCRISQAAAPASTAIADRGIFAVPCASSPEQGAGDPAQRDAAVALGGVGCGLAVQRPARAPSLPHGFPSATSAPSEGRGSFARLRAQRSLPPARPSTTTQGPGRGRNAATSDAGHPRPTCAAPEGIDATWAPAPDRRTCRHGHRSNARSIPQPQRLPDELGPGQHPPAANEHGCAYCHAHTATPAPKPRPGWDFETRLRCRPMAELAAELARPGCVGQRQSTSAPPPIPTADRPARWTTRPSARGVLKVFAETRPCTIVTKERADRTRPGTCCR